jgi:hypothetical protein
MRRELRSRLRPLPTTLTLCRFVPVACDPIYPGLGQPGDTMGSEQTGRPFTVTVLMVWESKVLLHLHRKLVWDVAGSVDRSRAPKFTRGASRGIMDR